MGPLVAASPDGHADVPIIVDDRRQQSENVGPPSAYHERSWTARLSLGPQWVRPSEHQDVLELEGYGYSRWLVLASADWVVAPPFAVGVFAGIAGRNDEAERGGPNLDETILLAGVEAPLVAGSQRTYVSLAPRIGYARGNLSVHGGGSATDGLAFGGEASLMFSRGKASPHFNFGLSLGAFVAPTSAPGRMGGDYDLGGIHLSLAGGFDG